MFYLKSSGLGVVKYHPTPNLGRSNLSKSPKISNKKTAYML